MNKVIVYPNEDGGICVVYPAPGCNLSIVEIARKDVPSGVPYLIVDVSELPADHTFFDAFTADFSSPDGYGVGAEAWFKEQQSIQVLEGGAK